MNYSAKKIYVTCGRQEIDEWVAYMKAHMDEVRQSLVQERVRHEVWYLGRDAGGLYLVGAMDADNHDASATIAAQSQSSVDQVHRAFKRFWDRSSVTCLSVPSDQLPVFDACEVLLDVRPQCLNE